MAPEDQTPSNESFRHAVALLLGLKWPIVVIVACFFVGPYLMTLIDKSITAKGAGVEVSLSASSDARAVLTELLYEVRKAPEIPNPKVNYLRDLLAQNQDQVRQLSAPTGLNEAYRKGFRLILQNDYDEAVAAFDRLYTDHPTTYNIDEIRRLLRDKHPTSPASWCEVLKTIAEKYRWNAPSAELAEMMVRVRSDCAQP